MATEFRTIRTVCLTSSTSRPISATRSSDNLRQTVPEPALQGEFGIGLLSFWTVGDTLTMGLSDGYEQGRSALNGEASTGALCRARHLVRFQTAENTCGVASRPRLRFDRPGSVSFHSPVVSGHAVFDHHRSPIPATNPRTASKPSDRFVFRPHSPANASKVGFHSAGGGSSLRGTSCVALFEHERLSSARGQLEFERTKRIVQRFLPSSLQSLPMLEAVLAHILLDSN
jgi:hypothetical protein